MNKDVKFSICFLTLAATMFFVGRACDESGTSSATSTAPLLSSAHRARPTSSGAGARPSTDGQVAQERESRKREVGGESPSLAVVFGALDGSVPAIAEMIMGLDDGVQPTAAGLFARTVDLWSQPEFLNLTSTEARELLPLDDELAAAPGSLLDLTGPLPTEGECERAFANPKVQALLEQTCAAEVQLYALEAARQPNYERAIEAQKRAFEADERDLMLELDRVSGFKGWSLMHLAYERWAQ